MTRWIVGVTLVALAFLAATIAPLFTYGTTLAAFGLAHVAVELRYVEARFQDRLRGAFLGAVLGIIAVIVALRVGKLFGARDLLPVELGLVGLLAASVFLRLGPSGGVSSAASVGLAMLVAVGVAVDPVLTMVLLSVAHNWTPVGFMAEATRGAHRRRVLALATVVFGLLPMVLALGWPQMALQGLVVLDYSVLPTGPLSKHLGVFVPEALRGGNLGSRLFAAVVFAQCMHYATVLGVLPRLQGDAAGPWLGRMRRVPWVLAVAVPTVLLFVGYTLDFSETRRLYSIAAAAHAWIEIPALLLALPGGQETRMVSA